MEDVMEGADTMLTAEQAYRAMLVFLERECVLTESSDLADLLSGYRMDSHGHTGDPAVWNEWIAAVEQALKAHPAHPAHPAHKPPTAG
jgi:hypothetical protein